MFVPQDNPKSSAPLGPVKIGLEIDVCSTNNIALPGKTEMQGVRMQEVDLDIVQNQHSIATEARSLSPRCCRYSVRTFCWIDKMLTGTKLPFRSN